jgi:hypothetical protein
VYIDASQAFRARGVPGPDPDDLISTDEIHATRAGHALLAQVIADRLAGS